MAQQQATLPNTHAGVREVINDNATDAETRLNSVESPQFMAMSSGLRS